MSNIFEKREFPQNELPADFLSVWNDFVVYYSQKYKEVKFEKIEGRELGKFYICARPKRDAAGTTTFAAIRKIENDSIIFQLTESLSEKKCSSKEEFADALFFLMDAPYTQAALRVMERINENGPFEGFIHDRVPYEITENSIKFSVDVENCDMLLSIVNSDQINEAEKIGKESTCLRARIIPNVYPQTSTILNREPGFYKYISFNGFLFDCKQVIQNGDGSIQFTGAFIRNMRM